ncbi:MAG: alanine:cation symporter family protein [Saprospiraceae bacterium]|nr:alanine:cation symporter family protein [Saprospiraceae bacterium]MBK8634160.1 alanine:cation symporter family protein [Saprospiraceae bacterium]MBP7643719.1 alanine:cation symporter family protein [Saprospiraceae bacterium]HMS68512.1 alanine/glycine:cation symporter family protein [Saprospiraceae bacterium]
MILTKSIKSLFLFISATLFPILSQAQGAGLDAWIDEKFTPVSNAFAGIVFYNIPGTNVPIVVALLVFGAAYFTLYFSFVNIRRFGLALRVVSGKYDAIEMAGDADGNSNVNVVDGDIVDTIRDESKHGEVSHFQALATAVSGTVGLGNIAGVAIAIAIGGPGATFWMIVCGLLGMSTKFVECTLGVKYRDIGPDGTVFGGPMYYLTKGFEEKGYKKVGKFLAVMFAILCIGGSFGGGNAAQANQAVQQMVSLFGLTGTPAIGAILGFVLAIIVGIVIIGGIKRIATVTEKLVPLMAVIYILACLIIVFMNFGLLDDAIALIMKSAFSSDAAVGGFFGVLVQGFRRAVFSNEAGAGSASIAHSAVKTKFPASEGIVALLEPFIDTVVICTLTALVIVLYNFNGFFAYGGDGAGNVMMNEGGRIVGGVDLTSDAFAHSISWFPIVLTIAIVLFAVSTMISWSYYGLQAWKYLFGKSRSADLTYKVLFLIMVVVGSASSMQAVFNFSDAMILGMVFPNMIGLFFLAGEVKKEINRYLKAIGEKTYFDVKTDD